MQPRPPKALLRLAGRAIHEFDMIRPGDRILLGVSGGKDSLTLLQILRHLQRHSPVKFGLGVVTVDPEVDGFDLSPLGPWLQALGVPWLLERQPLLERAREHMLGDSYCSWCARMKRGIMYAAARREQYNVLARERQMRDYAVAAGLPVIRDNCPACFRMPTQRAHMKDLLAREEESNHLLFKSLKSTLLPLMSDIDA